MLADGGNSRERDYGAEWDGLRNAAEKVVIVICESRGPALSTLIGDLKIGEAVHERFIIDAAKFNKRVEGKKS